MELTQLRYFVKLAETLNFTEAARQLCISQSTLSQSIRLSEQQLGVDLFERIGRKVFITEAGASFLPYARRSIEEMEAGVQALLDLEGVYRGELEIGVLYSLTPLFTLAAKEYSKRCPDVKLKIRQSSSIHELTELVRTGKLDFAYTYLPNPVPATIEANVIFSVGMSFAASENSEISKRKSVTMLEISRHPLVLLSSESYIRKSIMRLESKTGVSLNANVETNNASMLLRLVHTGEWCSILPRETIYRCPGLTAITIEGSDERFEAAIIRLREKYLKNTAKVFIDILSQK